MRLFISLDFDEPSRRRLVEMQAAARAALRINARWMKPEQLHATLKFIGDVDDAQASALAGAVRELELGDRFEVAVGRIERLPPRGPARVLAAAIEECDALQSLAGRVEAGCVDLGVAPERRRFHGHVTLARLRGQRISPESLEQIDLQTARLRPAAVRLMQSLLGPAGSTYVPLVSRFW